MLLQKEKTVPFGALACHFLSTWPQETPVPVKAG